MTTNLRKCIGCNNVTDRDEMFRIMKSADSQKLILSPSNKDFGRSFYICKNKECIEKAFKKGRIERHIKNENPQKIKDALINSL